MLDHIISILEINQARYNALRDLQTHRDEYSPEVVVAKLARIKTGHSDLDCAICLGFTAVQTHEDLAAIEAAAHQLELDRIEAERLAVIEAERIRAEEISAQLEAEEAGGRII
jgi:hypothetical protein